MSNARNIARLVVDNSGNVSSATSKAVAMAIVFGG